MYITMQPCHKSVRGTQGTKENWSCCRILVQLKGVEIVIKPTHLSKANSKKTDKNKQYHDLIDNAKEGIKKLMRTDNITLSKMESGDWKFLFELVQGEIEEEKLERITLDTEIGNFLQICQDEVKDETEQRDMESATEGMEQLNV